MNDILKREGILRDGKGRLLVTGKQFFQYVDGMIFERGRYKPLFSSDPVKTASNIAHHLNQNPIGLINARRSRDGRRALLVLYKTLASAPDDVKAQAEAKGILHAIGGIPDIDKGLVAKSYIFPAKFTMFADAHITAQLTKDWKINIKMYQRSQDDFVEAKALPTETFTPGVGLTLEPDEWVRIRLYDEGGITIYRPAAYFLLLSEKSSNNVWRNFFDVCFLALPGGPFLRLGGLATKGVAKVLEKGVGVLANALLVGNIAVRENRGWIIEKFGDKGRKFIEVFDLASIIASVYGVTKAITTPALKNLMASQRALKATAKTLSPSDYQKFSKISGAVDDFITNAEKTLDDLSPTLKGPRDTVDDLGKTWDLDEMRTTVREPQLRGSVTRPPIITYSEYVVGFLGDDVADMASRIGMPRRALGNWIDTTLGQEAMQAPRGKWGLELASGRAEARARRIVRAQITRTCSLGEDRACRLIAYGSHPNGISEHIEKLASMRLGMSQIIQNFDDNLKLMDYYAQTACSGNVRQAGARIRDHGGVRDAIARDIQHNLWIEWKATDPKKWDYDWLPTEMKNEKMAELLETAREKAKIIEQSILGSSASGFVLLEMKKPERKIPRKIREAIRQSRDAVKLQQREAAKRPQKDVKKKKIEEPKPEFSM